jgi:hypothetical protein
MHRAFIYVGLLEGIDKDIRHSFDITEPANIFQVGHSQLDGIHEILHVHRVFTLLVEKHVHIECVVVAIGGVIVVI